MTGAWTQAGPAIRVIIDRGPGQRAWIANDVAIDEIADAPEDLPTGREKRAGVEHHERINALAQRAPEEYGNDGEDRAKEGHTALPGRQDTPRLLQIAGNQVRLLDHEIETSSDEAGHYTPPEDTVDLV